MLAYQRTVVGNGSSRQCQTLAAPQIPPRCHSALLLYGPIPATSCRLPVGNEPTRRCGSLLATFNRSLPTKHRPRHASVPCASAGSLPLGGASSSPFSSPFSSPSGRPAVGDDDGLMLSPVAKYLASLGVQQDTVQVAAAVLPELFTLDVEKELKPAYRGLFELPRPPTSLLAQLRVALALHHLQRIGLEGQAFRVSLTASGQAPGQQQQQQPTHQHSGPGPSPPHSGGLQRPGPGQGQGWQQQQQQVSVHARGTLHHCEAVVALAGHDGGLDRLCALVEQRVRPLFELMRYAGQDTRPVAQAWSQHPALFSGPFLDNVDCSVRRLQDLGVDNRAIARFVANLHPGSAAVVGDLDEKVDFFKGQLGLSEEEVKQMIRKNPDVLSLGIDRHLRPACTYLRTWLAALAVGERDGAPGLRGLLLSNPRLLSWDVNTMDERVYFLSELLQDAPTVVAALSMPTSAADLGELQASHAGLLGSGMSLEDARGLTRIKFHTWMRESAAARGTPYRV